MVLSFSSCQKESFICECSGGISGGSYQYQINHSNREAAKEQCYKDPVGPDSETCRLQ